MKIAFAPLLFPTGQRPKGSGGEHVSRVICGNLCFKEKSENAYRLFLL